MIAKEIAKKNSNQTASFKRLIDYITRADSTQPLPANISNCGFDHLDTAVREVMAVQEMARKGHDKSYHLVLSFHPEDHIADKPDILAYIEDECCKVLGFGEHQRISVLHTDTEHPHLHIAINRVHPETLRQHTPYYSHRKLAAFCQQMEQVLGLAIDNHQPQHGALSQAALDMEAYSGKVSFERYLFEDVQPNIALDEISAWAELHQALGKYGLVLLRQNNGLVIGTQTADSQPVFVPAGTLGRDFAFNALQERLGAWEGASACTVPETTYQPAAPDGLWAQYQAARKASILGRQESRAKLMRESLQQQNALRSKYSALREEIKRDRLLGKHQKAALYQKLGAARKAECLSQMQHRQKERLLTVREHPLPTWLDFLVNKANAGDPQALAKLQRQANKPGFSAALAKLDEPQKQVLQNAKDRNWDDKIPQSVKDWIASRNALVGKTKDVIEHRLIDTQVGECRYQGTRQLKDAQIALLEKDGVMWVMPVSGKQQSLLRGQVRRGQTVTVGQNGYLQIHKTSRSRS